MEFLECGIELGLFTEHDNNNLMGYDNNINNNNI
jgi:hypothetical protein